MRVIIKDSAEDVGLTAAQYVIELMKKKDGRIVLGLPTGSTPLAMYRHLVEFHKNDGISFKNVITFNMDEYVGLPRNHPESYHSFMYNNFFNHIDIKPENIHILNGNAEDVKKECEMYELAMKNTPIDLFIGGIGADGHIAFNEPGSSLKSRTRIKTLNEETVKANSRFFDGDVDKVPKQALTVGVQTILDAGEVMILVTGSSKAVALHQAIEKGINHMCSASALQAHPNVLYIVDEPSTAELKVKTYRYFKSIDQ